MRTLTTALAVIAVVAASAAADSINVVNFGFYYGGSPVQGWTCTSDADPSPWSRVSNFITDDLAPDYDETTNTGLLLNQPDTGSAVTSTAWQYLQANTVAGNTYTISVMAYQYGWTSFKWHDAVRVGFMDRHGVKHYQEYGETAYEAECLNKWGTLSYDWTPTADQAGAGKIFFEVFNGPNDGVTDIYSVFDKVSVEYIPEPATMTLLGLGGLALLKRRRRA